MNSMQYEGENYYEFSAPVESPVDLEEPEMQLNHPEKKKASDQSNTKAA